MGYELARAAFERGADVTLISGPTKLTSIPGINKIDVKTSEDMFNAVKSNLKSKNAVIMSAAVADFRPLKVFDKKIKKEDKDFSLNISFERTTDILNYAGKNKKNFFLIGFALETNNGIENAKKKLKEKNLDLIVLNNPKDEGAGFNTDTNVVTLIDKKNTVKLPIMSKFDVGNAILDYYLNKSR
jgi:phosphopantothenoylcysteine decarboxylase/phosphopantothenate--cysteine ligase